MMSFTCMNCGVPIDPVALKRYCSYDCMDEAREEWMSVHRRMGADPPPFPRIGHYPDAPGVGK